MNLTHEEIFNSAERFWLKVHKFEHDENSCWAWTGSCRANKHGLFRVGDKVVIPYRFSYQIHNGVIPKGQPIWHTCNNQRCVRPSHLELGPVGKRRRGYGLNGRGRWIGVDRRVPWDGVERRLKKIKPGEDYRSGDVHVRASLLDRTGKTAKQLHEEKVDTRPLLDVLRDETRQSNGKLREELEQ